MFNCINFLIIGRETTCTSRTLYLQFAKVSLAAPAIQKKNPNQYATRENNTDQRKESWLLKTKITFLKSIVLTKMCDYSKFYTRVCEC